MASRGFSTEWSLGVLPDSVAGSLVLAIDGDMTRLSGDRRPRSGDRTVVFVISIDCELAVATIG